MENKSIYQHYQGTDAQCSGVQLYRELAFATDVGESGALRYMDCSGNIQHFYPDSQYWKFSNTDNYATGSGIYYKGPSATTDFIRIGQGLRFQYKNGVSNIIADTGTLTLSSNQYKVNISGAEGIEVKTENQDVSLISMNGDVNLSGDVLNLKSDCGDIIISSQEDVNISGIQDVGIVSTGALMLNGNTSGSFLSNGDLLIKTNKAIGNLNLEATYGGIINARATSAININTDSGDINLTANNNGSVNIASLTEAVNLSGDFVNLKTDCGDITLKSADKVVISGAINNEYRVGRADGTHKFFIKNGTYEEREILRLSDNYPYAVSPGARIEFDRDYYGGVITIKSIYDNVLSTLMLNTSECNVQNDGFFNSYGANLGTSSMQYLGSGIFYGDCYSEELTDYSATTIATGWSSLGVKKVFYRRLGKMVDVWYNFSGTSNSTTTTFILPYAAGVDANFPTAYHLNNNLISSVPPYCWVEISSSTATLSFPTGDWVASGTKQTSGHITYCTA